MDLMGLFTGDPAIKAAEEQRKLLQQTQTGVIDRTGNTKNEAAGYLNQGFNAAGMNLGTGYNTGAQALNQGAGNALGYLDQGTQGAVGALTAGGGAYAPLSALAGQYGKGAGLYADSLGINGPEGNTRALGAYQTAPGFENTLNTGIDAINRRANAGGMLQGGNANRDAIQFAHDTALKDYGQWQSQLGNFNNLQLGATQGAAAGNQGNNAAVAGILNSGGVNKAGVASGQGQSLGSLAQDYYAKMANLQTGQGGALAANATGATNAMNATDLNIAPQIGKTFQDAAAAELAGSKNLWGMGLAGAQMLAGMPPTGMGGGGAPATASSQIPSQSFMNNQWGW